MEFDIPRDQSAIIKVIGVGGGGGNAVNHMYNQGIKGVDFVVCNTDQQALDISPVPVKIQLGSSLTEGRGAGAIPEIGKNAAIENIDDVREILANNTKMVFITAGMGGGTGTGAAPVIAKVAKDMGILTVGIVTIPFSFEGKKRKEQAELGLNEMRKNVDTLLIIANDRLREMFGNLSLGNAFAQADDVLTTAAKGIAEVISVTGLVNVDFNDVSTVMKDSGVAIMGSATAKGENRALDAVKSSLNSPLLNDNDIEGATYVLLYITYGSEEILMDEIGDITDYIQDEAGSDADVIWGHGVDPALEEGICVTIIATGFNSSPISGLEKAPEKKVIDLDKEEVPTMISQPIEKPLESPTQANEWNETPIEETPFVVNKEVEEETPFVKTAEEISSDIAEVKSDLTDTPVEEVEQPIAETEEPTAETEEKTEQWYNAENEEEPYIKAQEEDDKQTEINWSFTSESAKEEEKNEVTEDISAEAETTAETTDETTAKSDEVVKHYLTDDLEEKVEMNHADAKQVLSAEEQAQRAKERMEKIQGYTSKLKSSSGLNELEDEPAYKRKNINIDDVPHSSEETMSRFTLSKDEDEDDEDTGLRENNSFLHDNVD